MAGNIKGIIIEIGGDTGPLDKALKDVNKNSRDLQSELRQVERLLKLDPGNTELLAQKQKLLAESVENTGNKLATLKEAEKQAQEQFAKGEISEENYRALQREVIKTEQELKTLESRLKETNDKWKEFGDKAKEIGEKTTDVGKKMSVGITAPIMAIGAASQVAWKEVDDALDTITTKTGATGDAAKSLEQSFKNVVGTLPTDIKTAGDAIGETNTQFGLMGEELDRATEKVIKFATINGQDVSRTAIDARQAIEAYGLSTEDLGLVLDAVTKAAQDTGQSTTLLFDKVTAGAPQMKALGLDVAQAASLMGQFEQKGVDSGKALSYLSKAQVTFAKDGKTLEQGLQDVTEKIKNSTNETEALTIASEIFGTKGATFMVDAIQRGALSLDDLANASKAAGGAVETTFDATLDPIDKSTVAMNNLKLAGADLGGSVQEALIPVLDKVVTLTQGLVDWFGGLSEETRTTIIVVAALAAGLGPVLVLIGTLITAIGTITTAIGAAGGAMAIVTGPIGLVVAAIVALIATGVLLYKNWDEITVACGKAWDWVLNKISSVITGTKNIINSGMEHVRSLPSEMFKIGENIVSGIWDGISNMASWLMNKVKNFVGGIVDGIKSKLKISSPSQVFADEVGKFMAQGIGVGFESEMGSVSNNIAKAIPAQKQDYVSGGVAGGTEYNRMGAEIGDFVYSAITDALKSVSDKQIVFNMDGRQWARVSVPFLRAENQRLGVDTV